eukprot:6799267-Alexandrium_andersonii.AAC.1
MDAWCPCSQDTVVVSSSEDDLPTPRGATGSLDLPLLDEDAFDGSAGGAAAGGDEAAGRAALPLARREDGGAAVAAWAARGAGA